MLHAGWNQLSHYKSGSNPPSSEPQAEVISGASWKIHELFNATLVSNGASLLLFVPHARAAAFLRSARQNPHSRASSHCLRAQRRRFLEAGPPRMSPQSPNLRPLCTPLHSRLPRRLQGEHAPTETTTHRSFVPAHPRKFSAHSPFMLADIAVVTLSRASAKKPAYVDNSGATAGVGLGALALGYGSTTADVGATNPDGSSKTVASLPNALERVQVRTTLSAQSLGLGRLSALPVARLLLATLTGASGSTRSCTGRLSQPPRRSMLELGGFPVLFAEAQQRGCMLERQCCVRHSGCAPDGRFGTALLEHARMVCRCRSSRAVCARACGVFILMACASSVPATTRAAGR